MDCFETRVESAVSNMKLIIEKLPKVVSSDEQDIFRLVVNLASILEWA